MISKGELSTIYKDCYFEESNCDIFIQEQDPNDISKDLQELTITGLRGSFLRISPKWLKDSKGPYNAEWNNYKLFCRDCDSIVLLNHDGQNYIVWIELKSSFNEVLKTALYQIVGSYMRSKSYLNAFSTYKQGDYKEISIIASHPDNKHSSADGNAIVFDNKKLFTGNDKDKKVLLAQKYRRKLKAGGALMIIEGTDFELDQLPLKSSVVLSKLPLVYLEADGKSLSVDINTIVNKI